ncbi:MAG: methyltransferase [Candidatus Nanoarchaeia archaeon]
MKAEHYYAEKPKTKYVKYMIRDRIRGFDVIFKSASGVFSAKKIDKASQLLIEKADLPTEGGRLLDLGCGYGVLGIVAAKACPQCEVVLTDINKRAVKLAKENVLLNRVRAKVKQGNGYAAVEGEKFDIILLNPPMAAGRDIVLKLIREAPHHLNPGGSLQIVARKTKGGQFLFDEMKKLFLEVKVLAKSGGFWVVKGVK